MLSNTKPQTSQERSKLCFNQSEQNLTVTILTGQTLSSEIDLKGGSLICISIPDNFDGSELKFHIWDGEAFKPAYVPSRTDDLDMKMKAVAGKAYPMVASDGAPFQRLKFESDVVQTTDLTIKLVTRFLV
jgi:hypothetical protein